MSASRLLQRALPVFLLFVLASSAYNGLTRLVGSVVGGRSRVAPQPTRAPEFTVSKDSPARGALSPNPTTPEREPTPLRLPSFGGYLAAPDCAVIAVHIVSEAREATESLATLRVGNEARLCRVGDRVAGHRVEFIGFNPRQSSAAVWLSKDRLLCQALVAAGEPRPTDAVQSAAAPAEQRVPREISENLRRLGEHEFAVSRAQFDSLFENVLDLGRQLRFVPERKGDQVVGVRLFGVREGSWPAALGLRNGDRLETLNGFPVSKPEALLEAYARLRTAPQVTARITRGGTPLELAVHVQ